MKRRLETKRADLEKHIASLTEAHPKPVDAIEASDGPQDFEEIAVDFLEIQQEAVAERIEGRLALTFGGDGAMGTGAVGAGRNDSSQGTHISSHRITGRPAGACRSPFSFNEINVVTGF